MQTADPVAARMCEVMQRQIDHMVRLVDDLLEVSRITRGKITLHREPADLIGIIRNAVDISRPLIDAAGHRLSITRSTRRSRSTATRSGSARCSPIC